MRLAICGPGQCGKGEASEFFAERCGFHYEESTSEAAARVVFNALKDKYGYKTIQECWNDRRNHRIEWASTISSYNGPTGVRLYEEMIQTSPGSIMWHQAAILDGIRRRRELMACKNANIVGLSVWIDRPNCPDKSLDYGPEACELIIENHGTLDDFYNKLAVIGTFFAAANGLPAMYEPKDKADKGG